LRPQDDEKAADSRRLSRRRFVLVLGGLATFASISAVARTLGLFNKPPKAGFRINFTGAAPQATLILRTPNRTLNFISPTSDDKVSFFDASTHPDKCGLICSLYVDDKLASNTTRASDGKAISIYSTQLPANMIKTEHTVKLEVAETERLVGLQSTSYDPDAQLPTPIRELLGTSADLKYSWCLDGSETSTDNEYSTRLKSGEHSAELHVSDGLNQDVISKPFSVIPHSPSIINRSISVDSKGLPQFPPRTLSIPLKGITYIVGMKSWGMPPVADEEIEECLAVIKETGCNSIQVSGEYVEIIIRCAALCLDSFDVIVLGANTTDMNFQEAKDMITILASEAETLRQRSSTRLILSIGNEDSLRLEGIVPGANHRARDAYIAKNGLNTSQMGKLEEILASISDEARRYFTGELTYAAPYCEAVNWLGHQPLNWDAIHVDLIMPRIYFNTGWTPNQSDSGWTDHEYVEAMKRFVHIAHGKPVFISEFGFLTFDDTLKYGMSGYDLLTQDTLHVFKYSQEAQANALEKNLELLNQTGVGAIFLWNFTQYDYETVGDPRQSPGIIEYRADHTWSRKLSFYEFQRWRT
jgi:hypothetical protein